DTLSKFEKILDAHGVHEALRFLNNRTSHRFTGIYRFEGTALKNACLFDAETSATTSGEEGPLLSAFCSIVGAFKRPFTTDDALRDDRLRDHPARGNVRSYCGVPLRRPDGRLVGTLCHFDVVPCDVPVAEVALMEAAAPLIMRLLGKGAG